MTTSTEYHILSPAGALIATAPDPFLARKKAKEKRDILGCAITVVEVTTVTTTKRIWTAKASARAERPKEAA